jgi:hypothetical protein
MVACHLGLEERRKGTKARIGQVAAERKKNEVICGWNRVIRNSHAV